jgi:hypothetical protein
MATIRTSLDTAASAEDAWRVIRDVGALHTRLAPGFVTDTRLEPGVRVATFVNGMVIREPIVTIDDETRRLVWAAEGGWTTHYNASLQVSAHADGGATVVWVADFLPDEVKPQLCKALEAGTRAMKRSFDALANEATPLNPYRGNPRGRP